MNLITNVIITKTALDGADFKEAVDLALVCAAFEHQVNLVFTDHAVFNLVKSQSTLQLDDKNHLNILKGLEFYDIENVYVEKESLDIRQLKLENLIDAVQLVDNKEISLINKLANHVVVI